ncbi:hypothetical protein ACFQ3Z_00595 [Streptomyces nogalater]
MSEDEADDESAAGLDVCRCTTDRRPYRHRSTAHPQSSRQLRRPDSPSTANTPSPDADDSTLPPGYHPIDLAWVDTWDCLYFRPSRTTAHILSHPVPRYSSHP